MNFRFDDIGNLLTFEVFTGDAKWDWACWAIIGVAALLLLVIAIAIIAKCVEHKKFKVIFNARGGRYNSTVKVKLGDKFSYPKDPIKNGYVFMGWFIDKKCKTRFASTELTERKNLNVYAKWMKETEYEQLNAQYSKAKAVAEPAAAAAAAPLQKDPQLERLEAEKLSYMAKKAEEERRTEEVKLQSIKEIEASKANDDARVKAEKDADEARAALDNAMKERETIIAQAKAEERNKCYSELTSSVKNDNINLALLLSGLNNNSKSNVDLDAELRKIKEEAKIEARQEFEEELKRKADEEARVNALVEARIKEYEEIKRKEEEIAKLDREKNESEHALLLLKLADAEKKLGEYEQASKQDAGDVSAKLFDRLKAEMQCYVKSDDLSFGVEKDVTVCRVTQNDDKDTLELNVSLSDLEEKGYNVTKGNNLPAAYSVVAEDDIPEGLELIEEAMSANGLMKSIPQVVYASSSDERKAGYDFVINNEKQAENVDEYYSLLRVYAGSFADVEGYDGEDLPLVKLIKDGDAVLVYLNHESDGLKAAEDVMVEQGYVSLIEVRDTDGCKAAMSYIDEMMKDNGLIRYPAMTGFIESGDDDGFAYVLKSINR